MHKIKIAILGASGYSGAELINILLKHKKVEIDSLFANAAVGQNVDEIYPKFKRILNKTYSTYSKKLCDDSDLIISAMPSGEALNIVPELLEMGKKVIDIGGDFRLKNASHYQTYYKRQHTAQNELSMATYGLTELSRESIKSARLISNPGCYPTSAILPLVPVLKEGLIKPEGIVINSVSGVSGAGRSSSITTSFCEVNESVKAYKVGNHQHIPEIEQALFDFSGKEVTISFIPHLIPITRGIYTTIHAALNKRVGSDEILEVFSNAYRQESFVRIYENRMPEIKDVLHSNFIDIGFRINLKTNMLILFSTIDNLQKGAAGQAVQNLNLMCGFQEEEALL